MMGPPALKAAHPIGKAPALEENATAAVVASNATFNRIIRHPLAASF